VKQLRSIAFLLAAALVGLSHGQSASVRQVSGVIVDADGAVVPGVAINASGTWGRQDTRSDSQGQFHLQLSAGPFTLEVAGEYLISSALKVGTNDPAESLVIPVRYSIVPVHENLVITASALDPGIDRRNGAIYKDTLFSRDDQIFDTLSAGINAGQHEGGGKSLEIRRFGFNLDHGGVSGGLKVVVDDVQQNQATQGHGQGYLGQLKSLTPELVDDVDILNGPFSAEYGDFSGLGVVHIRLKERLPEEWLVRLQGGSFGAFRGFVGFSPQMKNADSFVAYEGSHTDGPFISPLRYNRHNVTANYTRHLSQNQSLGLRFNAGTNDFFSSGQIPLDQVATGQLDRYGFVDPSDGGKVRSATLGAYYRRDLSSGDIFKLDGFVSRSLFDLYSDFTFFLNDPIHGDGIQQHDSRLQQGINTQYLHPYRLLGKDALLTFGGNFHDNQINVGLLHTDQRQPLSITTSAHAHVTNLAGYMQQGIDLWQRRLHLDAGFRLDYFRFEVADHATPAAGGVRGASRWQPKANLAFTPSVRVPLTFYASYGRGISSQDARGVVQRPAGPRVSTTDFFQVGTSNNLGRFAFSTDLFLIDRSNEQVYIPDDGSFELKGPSRSYGWEAKTSVRLSRKVSFNTGFTQVMNAFYRGTAPRLYIDSASHSVGNAGITVSEWRGFTGSLRHRHVSAYRLDGLDASIRATGLDVADLSLSHRLRHGVDFNLAIDNLNNKRYWETQNYFASRLTPEAPAISRIHATPGYPVGVTLGLTFRLGER
jgi:TonB-dependent receptor-like protein/carboxypeptidase family protein